MNSGLIETWETKQEIDLICEIWETKQEIEMMPNMNSFLKSVFKKIYLEELKERLKNKQTC